MGPSASKLDPQQLWEKHDVDKSDYLDRKELDLLVREVWKYYKPKTPLSDQVIDRVIDELDVNKDGNISKTEFLDLYHELVETLGEQLGADEGSPALATTATTAPAEPGVSLANATQVTSTSLRCPHCAFEIDPKDLDRLRVDPSMVQLAPTSWNEVAPRSEAAGSAAAASAGPLVDGNEVGGYLPHGTTYGGRVPPSFFMNPQGGWWAQRR